MLTESWWAEMLAHRLWNLDVDRKFIKHGCWQKCLWSLDVHTNIWSLSQYRSTDSTLDTEYIKTSSSCTISCIINLWNAYKLIKNFLSKLRLWKTFWQLDCQIAALFPPMHPIFGSDYLTSLLFDTTYPLEPNPS